MSESTTDDLKTPATVKVDGTGIVHLRCQCGQKLKIRPKHNGKVLFCGRCGHELPLTPSSLEKTSPPSDRPTEKNESLLQLLVTLCCVLSALGIGCGVVNMMQLNRITPPGDWADQQLQLATNDALEWLKTGEEVDALKIEMTLEQALRHPEITDRETATPILKRVRKRRLDLEMSAKRQTGQREAERLWESAQQSLKDRDLETSIRFWNAYLIHPDATRGTEAIALIKEAQWVTSDQWAVKQLLEMSPKDLNDLKDGKPLPLADFSNGVMREMALQSLRRNSDFAASERLIRDSRQRLLDSEKRLLEIEKWRKGNDKQDQQVELAQLRRLSSNYLTDFVLQTGNLELGEMVLTERIKTRPRDAQTRFGLGLVKFFRAIERFGQSLYRHGALSELDQIPFFRVPIPPNPNPVPITCQDARAIMDRLRQDLDEIDLLLTPLHADGAIEDRDFKMLINLARVQMDFDGDQIPEQQLGELAQHLFEKEFKFLEKDNDLLVHFDMGDVYWLRIYCNLLSGMLDTGLAVDWRPFYRDAAPHFFANPDFNQLVEPPVQPGMGTAWLPLSEPKRLSEGRRKLVRVTLLNREMWRQVRREKDNDHEWLPNARQDSVLGISVRDDLVTLWLSAIDDVGEMLEGEKGVPTSYGSKDGRPLNLKYLLDHVTDRFYIPLQTDHYDNLDDEYYTDADDISDISLIVLFQAYTEWFN